MYRPMPTIRRTWYRAGNRGLIPHKNVKSYKRSTLLLLKVRKAINKLKRIDNK